MTMSPRTRKLALTSHVIFSVGWLGAVAAYLPLAIAGLRSEDAEVVRAAYLAMEQIGWFVIVPLCLAALVSGLVQSLGTEWGLFRHYWVLVKFGITVISTIILLLHMPAVSRTAAMAREMELPIAALGLLQRQLFIHAALGLLVLIAITAISVFKPWVRTRLR